MRIRRWSPPQAGVSFLFGLELLGKSHSEAWRAFDRAFVGALSSLVEQVPKEERIEVWGGLSREGGEEGLFVSLAGQGLPSEIVKNLYDRIRRELPEGAVVFAGSAPRPAELLPLFCVGEGQVFRCAVSDGAAPVLRLVVFGEQGPVMGAVPASPINLAAMVDNLPGVSVLVVELEGEEGGFSEDGDRPEVAAPGEALQPSALDAAPGEARPAGLVEGGAEPPAPEALPVAEADVVSVRELGQEGGAEAAALDAAPTEAPAAEKPSGPKRAPRFLPSLGENTLIDISDDDITVARPIAAAPLASLSDEELRQIFSAAPTEASCLRLGEALGRPASEIARVFSLASGAATASEIEVAFAARARLVARELGWLLLPDR